MLLPTAVEGLLWCGTAPGALEDMKLKETYSWLCEAFYKIRVRRPIEGCFLFFVFVFLFEERIYCSFGKHGVESAYQCAALELW